MQPRTVPTSRPNCCSRLAGPAGVLTPIVHAAISERKALFLIDKRHWPGQGPHGSISCGRCCWRPPSSPTLPSQHARLRPARFRERVHRNVCCMMQHAIAKASPYDAGACLGIGRGPPGCCRLAATARCPPLLQHSNSLTRGMQSALPQLAKTSNTPSAGPQLSLSTAFKPRTPPPAIHLVHQPPPRQSYSTDGLCRNCDVPTVRQHRTPPLHCHGPRPGPFFPGLPLTVSSG